VNTLLRLLSTLALALTSLAAQAADPSVAPKSARSDQHVILITIDGFPARFWHDESLPLVNLRRLAKDGAAVEAMTVSNPSITWINHTTLSTGVTPRRHGVLYNGLLVRQGPDQQPKIEPWVDKSRMVFAPTIYDLAYRAGLTTAEVDWVAITRPGTIHWSFPEIPSVDGTVEKEMIAAGLLRPEQIGWFHGRNRKNMTWEDHTWTQAACFIFEKHRPNLLLHHLLNTDSIQHQYAPGSAAAYTALSDADRQVGDLLAAVQRSGVADRTTVIVTSDHGFKKINKLAFPNVLLRQAGLLTARGSAVARCDAVAMAQAGMAFIYITNPARKAELLPQLKKLFAKAEGVAQVLDGHDGPTVGMPTPEENQGMGDLVLFAKAGYSFKGEAGGDAAAGDAKPGYLGTHGYLATDPELDGFFVAHGPRIKPGVTLGRISNLDVAPTVAQLLGLKIPNAEGRVLNEILAGNGK
jgi:predicted AlkP superfamily pyrophosphatase or phosphodiesterase